MMAPMQEVGRSPIRFARVDGVAIAYQTWGDGPVDVVVVPPLAQNIELAWERPEYRALFARMGSFARVLHFDKRGTGASDRTMRMPTIDQRVEDLVAVMEAAGVERAHVLGLSEGGPVAIALAATYPERVETLALFGSGARTIGDETDEERDAPARLRRPVLPRAVGHGGVGHARRVRAERGRRCGLPGVGTAVRAAVGDAGRPPRAARHDRGDRRPAAPRGGRRCRRSSFTAAATAWCPSPWPGRRRRCWPVPGSSSSTATITSSTSATSTAGSTTTSGSSPARSGAAPRARRGRDVRIATMGGFRVTVDGEPVPASAWGSRQARLVCKRLAVAVDRPIPRDELADLLWPDELDPPSAAPGSRSCCPTSGGCSAAGSSPIATRCGSTSTPSTSTWPRCSRRWRRATTRALAAAHTGPVLPEDAYEDWAITARERISSAVISARRRLAGEAEAGERWDEVVEHARAVLELDGFDERAHELLVRSLRRLRPAGRGAARRRPLPGTHGRARRAAAGSARHDARSLTARASVTSGTTPRWMRPQPQPWPHERDPR